VNIIVTTAAGRQMRFNPLGPKLLRSEWAGLVKLVQGRLKQAGLLILSGSLPRGVPVSAYADFVRLAHMCGVNTLLDCDGPALAAAVKARPFLVKPNEHELAQWWGRAVKSESQAVQAARALSKQTQGWVLVSRGPQRALLLNHGERFECFVQPPKVKVRNTVGAGDALLAAVARQVQLKAFPESWLREGVNVGAEAARCVAGWLAS
jgi:1-phosphofructokinase family hexose kinase